MNALEDRLRDAYRALADTVDPAGIPGLTVSTGPRLTVSRRMRFVSALAAAAAARAETKRIRRDRVTRGPVLTARPGIPAGLTVSARAR